MILRQFHSTWKGRKLLGFGSGIICKIKSRFERVSLCDVRYSAIGLLRYFDFIFINLFKKLYILSMDFR